MRLLVAEDDADVARFLRRGLSEQAYAVDVVEDGDSAIEMAAINPYDVVILDLMIPGPDGLEVCRRLRAGGSSVPILMLTARGGVDEKIAGLDAGADDYLAKPFEFGELLARLRALLRRGTVVAPLQIRVGDLEIDTRSHRVAIGGQPITLTTKEYSVLEFLARNSGRIVTREELAEHVWSQEFDPFSNLIEVYINRLRRHFDRTSPVKLIHTVRGAGYMLEAESPPAGDG